MPTPPGTTISPRLSIGTSLVCYVSACLYILFISVTLKGLELSERVVASMLAAVVVGNRAGSRNEVSPRERSKIVGQSNFGTSNEGECDIIHPEDNRENVYGVVEHIQDQINEQDLDDQEDEDDDIQPENYSKLCEYTTGAEKHLSRWGAVPSSEERGKKKMEYVDSPDSPCAGQMDTSVSDFFDDMSSAEYCGIHMLPRPFVLNSDLAHTVTPAQSGDSIASDDPFLPPGLGPLALSLTPRHTYNTCIQPGSAAASSSSSRMGFATLVANDTIVDSVIGDQEEQIKTSPTELMKTRLGRETDGKKNALGSPGKTDTAIAENLDIISNANTISHEGAHIIYDPKAVITKTKTNTPTQIYRALSTLSFWTPAPKISVTIAPPMKRRRGGRRRDKGRNKEKKNESMDHDVFGERMLLQQMDEN